MVTSILSAAAAAPSEVKKSEYCSCPHQDNDIGSCCDLGFSYSKFAATSNNSGVYQFNNFCGNCRAIVSGYCDTVTAGGGWLVIQRRQDGSVDFNRDWVDYEYGFGSLTGEVWYGLRAMNCLTNQGQWELRIDYILAAGTKGHLSYNNFRVGPASEQYPITISGFDGVATNDPIGGLNSLNGMKFTTRDRDNDMWTDGNCAVNILGIRNGGGWWYRRCTNSFPNNQFHSPNILYFNFMWHSVRFLEIKIRPKDCIN